MNYPNKQGELLMIDEELGIELRSASLPTARRLFFPNGTLRMEAHYADGKLHGLSQFFSEAGILLSKTWFYEGMTQGKATHYYPSGQLFSIQRFKDGVRVGVQEYYYENGAPKTLIPYDAEGHLHGTVILYALDGSINRKCSFKHGATLE